MIWVLPLLLMIAGQKQKAASNPFVYVSGYGADIALFTLDMTSGTLQPHGTAVGAGSSPSYLAWDRARKHLYALQEQDAGRIVAYSIGATGMLTRINDASSGGKGPAHLSVDRTGKWVLSSNYGDGRVAVLPIQANGGVGEPVFTDNPVPKNAHQIIEDPAGRFAFVPCTGPNVILQYRFDAKTGKLTPNTPFKVPGTGEPRHLAFHPGATYAYAVNEAAMSVTSFAYDASKGALTAIETIPAAPAGGKGTGAHILVHPSGRFVYASLRGPNHIAIFSVDAATGRLTHVADETGGGVIRTPRDFTVDPTGAFLLVANQETGSVTVFRINPSDGRLTLAGTTPAIPKPAFVGVLASK
jgi:6-phosphogluconolactonase